MSDLISRQAAITLPVLPKEHREYQTSNLDDAYEKGWMECQKCIEDLPSAEPVQHEECEYIITKGKAGYHEEYTCSSCGDSFYWTQDRNIPRRFNYCRNCGRKIIRFIEKEVNG